MVTTCCPLQPDLKIASNRLLVSGSAPSSVAIQKHASQIIDSVDSEIPLSIKKGLEPDEGLI